MLKSKRFPAYPSPPPPHPTIQMLWSEIMRVAPYQINYESRINYPSRVNYSLSVECCGNGSGLTFMTFSSYIFATHKRICTMFFFHILCYKFRNIYLYTYFSVTASSMFAIYLYRFFLCIHVFDIILAQIIYLFPGFSLANVNVQIFPKSGICTSL
jgi:hypothetical protein